MKFIHTVETFIHVLFTLFIHVYSIHTVEKNKVLHLIIVPQCENSQTEITIYVDYK